MERARRAVGLGCVIAIDSDAHDWDELDDVRWGISQARRAWVEAPTVVNTWSRADLLAWAAGKPGPHMSGSGTTSGLLDRSVRRDLSLVAVTIVGLSRLLEPPLVWVVAGLLLGAMLLGTLQVLSDDAGPGEAWAGVAIEALIVTVGGRRRLSRRHKARAVRVVARSGAGRHLPGRRSDAGARIRIHRSIGALSVEDRTAILLTTLLVAFLAFTGVAAMVPGGLIQGATGETLATPYIIALVAGDAVVATMLGYRVAALRVISARHALWLALTYGAAIAISAAAVRAAEIQRLVGPALLDARLLPLGRLHRLCARSVARPTLGRSAGGPARRWGIVVTAWNLLLRA